MKGRTAAAGRRGGEVPSWLLRTVRATPDHKKPKARPGKGCPRRALRRGRSSICAVGEGEREVLALGRRGTTLPIAAASSPRTWAWGARRGPTGRPRATPRARTAAAWLAPAARLP